MSTTISELDARADELYRYARDIMLLSLAETLSALAGACGAAIADLDNPTRDRILLTSQLLGSLAGLDAERRTDLAIVEKGR